MDILNFPTQFSRVCHCSRIWCKWDKSKTGHFNRSTEPCFMYMCTYHDFGLLFLSFLLCYNYYYHSYYSSALIDKRTAFENLRNQFDHGIKNVGIVFRITSWSLSPMRIVTACSPTRPTLQEKHMIHLYCSCGHAPWWLSLHHAISKSGQTYVHSAVTKVCAKCKELPVQTSPRACNDVMVLRTMLTKAHRDADAPAHALRLGRWRNAESQSIPPGHKRVLMGAYLDACMKALTLSLCTYLSVYLCKFIIYTHSHMYMHIYIYNTKVARKFDQFSEKKWATSKVHSCYPASSNFS